MAKQIPLVNSPKKATVDDDDYEWLMKYEWFLDISSTGREYAATIIDGKKHFMHDMIVERALSRQPS